MANIFPSDCVYSTGLPPSTINANPFSFPDCATNSWFSPSVTPASVETVANAPIDVFKPNSALYAGPSQLQTPQCPGSYPCHLTGPGINRDVSPASFIWTTSMIADQAGVVNFAASQMENEQMGLVPMP